MLLVASYVFYGAWDYRFLSLLFISTAIDYICGLKIYESEDARKRKIFLLVSVFANLAILGFFKYFNFFAVNLQMLLSRFGLPVHLRLLNIILPVGISFYTFQTMSYTIDIYRRALKPTRRFFDFALFVSFFPQLVAGPIERAVNLLPQILSPRKLNLDKFYQGCYLIFWGLFMKVFVADNLAKIVDALFSTPAPYNGALVLLGLYAFAFQIFCDFAGYSNIARGLGKCMGFDIMVNFNLPYFAKNPREFWQRWHISLSTWLRDYLYVPLGGNRKGPALTYFNLAITMFLGGLWHGAAWTFIIWGIYQGALLIVHRLASPLLEKIPSPKNLFLAKAWVFVRIIFFFHLVCLGWLIFRAGSVNQVIQMLQGLFFNFHVSHGIGLFFTGFKLIFFSWLLIFVQLVQYHKADLMAVYKWPPFWLAVIHAVMFYLIMKYSTTGYQFIYFQF